MERIITKLGGFHLYVDKDNYMYIRSKKRGDVYYLRCRKRNCPGKANVKDNNTSAIKVTCEHNHKSDFAEVEQFRFVQKLQCRAANEYKPLSQIYNEEIQGKDIANLKFNNVRTCMTRARSNAKPPIPTSLEQLGEILLESKWQDRYTCCIDEEHRKFFRKTMQTEDGSCIVLFMSPTFECFAKTGVCLRLHVDTMCKVVPKFGKHKTKLIVIHVYIGEIAYPLLHAITDEQSCSVYVRILKYMIECVPNINIELFVTNDETSFPKAASPIFPNTPLTTYKEPQKSYNDQVETYNEELKVEAGHPSPNIWKFIEILKEKEYAKVCYFMHLQDRKIPKRWVPKSVANKEIQTDFNKVLTCVQSDDDEDDVVTLLSDIKILARETDMHENIKSSDNIKSFLTNFREYLLKPPPCKRQKLSPEVNLQKPNKLPESKKRRAIKTEDLYALNDFWCNQNYIPLLNQTMLSIPNDVPVARKNVVPKRIHLSDSNKNKKSCLEQNNISVKLDAKSKPFFVSKKQKINLKTIPAVSKATVKPVSTKNNENTNKINDKLLYPILVKSLTSDSIPYKDHNYVLPLSALCEKVIRENHIENIIDSKSHMSWDHDYTVHSISPVYFSACLRLGEL